MKRAVLIGMVLLFLIPVLGLAKNQHINILFDSPDQIDGSNPSYIEHGMWDYCSNVPGPSPRSAQTDPSYLLPTIELALWIDGEFVEPGHFIVYKRPEHTTPPVVDGDAWYFNWRYQFKANYFSNGSHHFYLQWLLGGEVEYEAELWLEVVDSRKKD